MAAGDKLTAKRSRHPRRSIEALFVTRLPARHRGSLFSRQLANVPRRNETSGHAAFVFRLPLNKDRDNDPYWLPHKEPARPSFQSPEPIRDRPCTPNSRQTVLPLKKILRKTNIAPPATPLKAQATSPSDTWSFKGSDPSSVGTQSRTNWRKYVKAYIEN